MKEAISKYTALEVLHVVGPEREEPGERCPSSVRCQDVGSSAPPCWFVRAAAGVGGGASSGAPGAVCSRLLKEKGSLVGTGGFCLGEVCTWG